MEKSFIVSYHASAIGPQIQAAWSPDRKGSFPQNSRMWIGPWFSFNKKINSLKIRSASDLGDQLEIRNISGIQSGQNLISPFIFFQLFLLVSGRFYLFKNKTQPSRGSREVSEAQCLNKGFRTFSQLMLSQARESNSKRGTLLGRLPKPDDVTQSCFKGQGYRIRSVK